MIPLIILAIEDPEDRAFMEDVYISHRELMYAYIRKELQDKWECETDDIMQSALEKLVDKISTLKALGVKQRASYIITTCKNETRSYLRKAKRIEYMEDEDLEALTETPSSPEMLVLDKERSENMYEVFKRLDEKSKSILERKYKLKMSDAEIAKEMGIRSGSVRMALTRARDRFKQKYKELYNIEV